VSYLDSTPNHHRQPAAALIHTHSHTCSLDRYKSSLSDDSSHHCNKVTTKQLTYHSVRPIFSQSDIRNTGNSAAMKRLLTGFFFLLTGFLSVTGSNGATNDTTFSQTCTIILSWGQYNGEFCIPLLSKLNQPLYLTSSYSWNLRIDIGNPGINALSKCMYATSIPVKWDARQTLYEGLASGSLWLSSSEAPYQDIDLGTPRPNYGLGCNDALSVAIGCQDEGEPQLVLNLMAPQACGQKAPQTGGNRGSARRSLTGMGCLPGVCKGVNLTC